MQGIAIDYTINILLDALTVHKKARKGAGNLYLSPLLPFFHENP